MPTSLTDDPTTTGPDPSAPTAAQDGTPPAGPVSASRDVDVLIVGAGLSGVGAAWRLQQRRPGTTYAILEARDDLGGTWDLFRYPGVRSDSDMATFSFPYAPWDRDEVLANGADIQAYVRDVAREAGIDRRIHFRTRVRSAHWDGREQRWTVETTGPDGRPAAYRARFLFCCTGYYDYERGHEPEFAGREDFAGEFVHPQHWPADLDHSGKRVVVIGSGATAVTLVPAMAADAAHVTMLQRTPTWMAALPNSDPLGDRLRRRLPANVAHRLLRVRNIATSEATYRFARACPERFGAVLHRGLGRDLSQADLDAHFTPPYRPWDQRVCRVPAGDLTKAITRGDAEVVTDTIDRLVPEGVRLSSGRVLPADVIVSATGLRLLPLGGIDLTVDGEPVDVASRFAYRGLMLEGVPNLAFTVGYTNASWTLRSDLVARYVCRLLRFMDARGVGVATPKPPSEATRADPRPLIGLASGYVTRAVDRFPKLGTAAPWTYRQSYLAETPALRFGDVRRGMTFAPARAGVPSGTTADLEEIR